MASPIPKAPELRQRRNKAPTRATLEVPEGRLEIPDLPRRGRRRWHVRAVAFWESVRRSPMAGEYLEADLEGLFVLADLVDTYWRYPDVKTAAEIRQQRQCFGLTPIDRRRLEWIVQRVDAGAQKTPRAPSRQRTTEDPRDLLKVVS